VIKFIHKKFEIKSIQVSKIGLNIFSKNYSNFKSGLNNFNQNMTQSNNSKYSISPFNFSHKSNKLLISNYFSFSNMESTILRTKDEILAYLKSNGVEVHHIEDHEKLDTVQLGLEKFKNLQFSKGEFTFVKNLFMKNKAGGLYLLTVHPVRKFK
jgi:hypothetical protein